MDQQSLMAGALLLAALPIRAQNPVELQLVPWATGLSQVVDLAHAGDDRLFAARRQGLISIISDSMTVVSQPFLDITAAVNDQGGEQGLLGLTFDPDYANNGFFYVHYTAGTGNGISRISRWRVSSDPDSADTASEQVLYEWPQPFANHNGGDLEFGPDGHLYVGFGDGGSGGDPQNNAQDLSDPLGDIIRLDVSDPDTTYTIPPDNPWVGLNNDTLPEIWASGLRNPYRFGFDRITGDLWIGDVGQSAWEELDFWPAGDNSGPNFGWRCYEGDAPYNTGGCQGMSTYEFPVSVHENIATGGTWCSAIGGRVYRGATYPRLVGRHIYTDYCAGEFWMLTPDGFGGWVDELGLASGTQGYVVIAEDVNGELYTGNTSNGQVRKIVDRCPMDPPSISFDGAVLSSTAANDYQWYLNGDPIGGATGQTWAPTSNGFYYVVGGFANNCELRSDTLEMVSIGLAEVAGAELLHIYPQPADEELVVEWMPDAVGQRWQLVDVMGRELLSGGWPVGRSTVRIDVRGIAPGSAVMRLMDAEGRTRASRPVLIR